MKTGNDSQSEERRNKMQKALRAAFFVGILATAAPSFAQVYFNFGIRLGPPQPLQQVIAPCPQVGWVWIPGYWSWNPGFDNYYWVRGYWTPPPSPYAQWIAPRWEQMGGRWLFSRGYWADRDRWGYRGGNEYRGYWGGRGGWGHRGHLERGGHREDNGHHDGKARRRGWGH